MKKFVAAALLSLMSLSSFANEGDLVLAGEKWIASFKGYNCAAFGQPVAAPSAFARMNVVFEKITTDSTLDNGLIKATFTERGAVCRYNAFLFADNAAATIRLVDSKAYAPAKNANCAEGKRIIDAALEANNYLYWGHPHNLTIMAPVTGAQAVCGNGLIGINFVVSGRVQK